MTGAQRAYYLKKHKPEFYEKAKRIKEQYGLRWSEAIDVALGRRELKPRLEPKSLVNKYAEAVKELRGVDGGGAQDF